MMPQMQSDRVCGDCTACCTENPVPELNKAPKSACSNCVSNRCTIYDNRPPSCAAYNCAWLTGILPAWASPKITGVVADLQELSVPPIVGKRLTWVVKETRPNAAGSEGGNALISLLLQTGLTGAQGIAVAEAGNIPVVLVTHDSAPGQGRVIEGIVADQGSQAHVLARKPGGTN